MRYSSLLLTLALLATLAACRLSPGPGEGGCRDWNEVLNLAHELCLDLEGEMYYCGPDGNCLEASGCEALDCCLPGEQGDHWCMENFGNDSSCIAGPMDGYCGRNR